MGMKKFNIISLCDAWEFPYKDYIDRVLAIGDVCAIREDKKGKPFRRDFERAFVVMAAAHRYKATRILEFGTGRGFVTGCLTMLDHVKYICTIDKLKTEPIVELMSKLDDIDMKKIRFISKNSYKIEPDDIGIGYDLSFIDGEHTARAVDNDFQLSLRCCIDDGIIVFDDYREKHAGVKKFIKSLDFDKAIVNSDGWLYKNRMINKHGDADKVVDGKEYESGQVILFKSGYIK